MNLTRMVKLAWILLITLSLHAQRRPENIALFYGQDKHTLRSLMDTRPPYVSLDDVVRSLGLAPAAREGNSIALVINRRSLELNIATQTAVFLRQRKAISIREREGVVYLKVDTLSEIFTELLGRRMVYEPTSFTLHLPKDQKLSARLVTRQVDGKFRLDLLYSKPIPAPKVTRNRSIIAISLAEPELTLDRSSFLENEAIETIEVFDKLPDGSTEILLYMTDKVTGYSNAPYTTANPRTTLTFEGDFAPLDGEEPQQNQQDQGIRRIVIDPGHGGKDVGATGPSGLREKDVVLQLCKELQEKLRDTYGYDVKLTRRNDIFLSHKTRTGIANNYKADLFLSLHANAIKDKSARGSETFYLSLDTQQAHNFDHYHHSEALEEDQDTATPTPDPTQDDLSLILWDMAQTKHMDDSFRIAKYIQRELNILARIRSRGVKQAPLKVLKGATMPAVLIEAAFISNPSEEAKLKSPQDRALIVDSIAKAISQYDAEVRQRNSGAPIEDFDLEEQP